MLILKELIKPLKERNLKWYEPEALRLFLEAGVTRLSSDKESRGNARDTHGRGKQAQPKQQSLKQYLNDAKLLSTLPATFCEKKIEELLRHFYRDVRVHRR